MLIPAPALVPESGGKPDFGLGPGFDLEAGSALAPGLRLLAGSAPLSLELEAGLGSGGLCAGPADVVATGIFGATVEAGAAGGVRTVLACDFVVRSGVRGPDTAPNTRGGSQNPDMAGMQVDHAGSKLRTSGGTESNGEHGSYEI